MKLFIKLWHWFRNYFRPAPPASSRKGQVAKQVGEKFRYSIVSETPELLIKDCIYILNEGFIDEVLCFICPCGCKSIIELNLLKDTKPVWKYTVFDDKITISPSIWRTIGCKSHFFIRHGKVMWAKD